MTATPAERLDALIDQARRRGRTSLDTRLRRLRSRAWFIGQAAVAAGVAWLIAAHVFDHAAPVFAPIVAVICLGMSYTQRLQRVVEVTVGVAIGIFLAGAFVSVVGPGGWQISMVVLLAMTVAVLLDVGDLLVFQSAIQGIFVAAMAPGDQVGFTRWQDAVIGGAVALVAAAVVPGAPLRRPRRQASIVARTTADLLHGSARAGRDADLDAAVAVLERARATDPLVRELQQAADEGMAVIAASPFWRKESGQVRRMADLIDPLDRALRGTRVLARRVLVAVSEGTRFPPAYLGAIDQLAAAAEVLAHVLGDDSTPANARPALVAAGQATGDLPRTGDLSLEVVLGQMRSVVVDLLQATGMETDEAIAALPPVRPA